MKTIAERAQQIIDNSPFRGPKGHGALREHLEAWHKDDTAQGRREGMAQAAKICIEHPVEACYARGALICYNHIIAARDKEDV